MYFYEKNQKNIAFLGKDKWGNEILANSKNGLAHGLSTKCGKFYKLVLGTMRASFTVRKKKKRMLFILLDLKMKQDLMFVLMNKFVSL